MSRVHVQLSVTGNPSYEVGVHFDSDASDDVKDDAFRRGLRLAQDAIEPPKMPAPAVNPWHDALKRCGVRVGMLATEYYSPEAIEQRIALSLQAGDQFAGRVVSAEQTTKRLQTRMDAIGEVLECHDFEGGDGLSQAEWVDRLLTDGEHAAADFRRATDHLARFDVLIASITAAVQGHGDGAGLAVRQLIERHFAPAPTDDVPF